MLGNRSLLFFFLLVNTVAATAQFVLKGNTVIYASAHTGDHLYLAVLALQRDMKKVLGQETSIKALHNAEKALRATEHGNFSNWYAGDSIFDFKNIYETLTNINTSK